jgi:hypothetical protein
VLIHTWREVAQVEYDALRAITFADLVKRIHQRSENMFYIRSDRFRRSGQAPDSELLRTV